MGATGRAKVLSTSVMATTLGIKLVTPELKAWGATAWAKETQLCKWDSDLAQRRTRNTYSSRGYTNSTNTVLPSSSSLDFHPLLPLVFKYVLQLLLLLCSLRITSNNILNPYKVINTIADASANGTWSRSSDVSTCKSKVHFSHFSYSNHVL